MARTISEIQQQIIGAKEADAVLGPALTSTSRVAIWRSWTYIVAVCTWALENLFDVHKAEVAAMLATQKPHTLLWYVRKAKAFQYGDILPPERDVYDVISDDPEVLIVRHAAATEFINTLRIKVAKEVGGVLVRLDDGADLGDEVELPALTEYMMRIKDAGVRLQMTSGDPDDLKLKMTIYYDPLVLDSNGERLDGTAATPVKDAIRAHLRNMPFNGLLVLNRLIDTIEVTEGVRIAVINAAQANYGDTDYVDVAVKYLPDAGYLALNETYFDDNVTYVAQGPI